MPGVNRIAARSFLPVTRVKSWRCVSTIRRWPTGLLSSFPRRETQQSPVCLVQSRNRSSAAAKKYSRSTPSQIPRNLPGRARVTFNGISVRERLKDKKIVLILIERLQHLAEQLKDVEFTKFAEQKTSILQYWSFLGDGKSAPPIFSGLRQAYVDRGQAGLDAQIKFAYHGAIANQNFSALGLDTQAQLADLRYPIEWYPATRMMQREIHLHVGPTNSGKTYHALKRLEQAKSGIYAGPLRLLAHEIYTRLNAKGIPCNLVTGDERQISEIQAVKMSSCTVEMVPINTEVEVAIIDEIQMIGHEERGWAWTQALLGLQAKEVHLCGEERTVPLIRELAAAMGDNLKIHHYQRLSPLKPMTTSLQGDLSNLRKGDCVVVFSRLGIHAMKTEIERTTKKRVAVVYGGLPPDIRAQQARLFNDPNNDYDILVASDAIGMGLNLSIKRIIFESTSKWNGHESETISTSSIKQIAGRAGRYRTAAQADTTGDPTESVDTKESFKKPSVALPAQNLGLVTTLESMDLSVVKKAMQTEADPIMSAGIFPPTNVLMQFAAHYPERTPFSYVLIRLHELALKHPRFHLCILKDQVRIADAIEPVKELTISDRIVFIAAPVNTRNSRMASILQALAQCVANNGGGALLDIPEIDLDVLDLELTTDKLYLNKLEDLHKSLILYLWLSYRFTGVFTSQRMTFHAKSLVEQKIDKVLSQVTYEKGKRDLIRRKRQANIFRNGGSDFEPEDEATEPIDTRTHTFPSSTSVPLRTPHRVLEVPAMSSEGSSAVAG